MRTPQVALACLLAASAAAQDGGRPEGEGAAQRDAVARAALARDLLRASAREYECRFDGAPCGRVLLRQEKVRDEEGRTLLRFTDTVRLEGDGGPVELRFVTDCAPDGWLTPARLRAERSGGPEDPLYPLEASCSGNRIAGSRGGRPFQREAPPPYLTEFTLLRFVTLLPLEAGSELRCATLETANLRLQRDQVLRCAGPEELQAGPGRRAAWRFEVAGADGVVGSFWVGEDRALLRAAFRGRLEWVAVETGGGGVPEPEKDSLPDGDPRLQ